MAGRRTYATFSTESHLDFELESKIGPWILTPTEVLLALLSPFLATGLTVLILFPIVRYYGMISIFFWFWLIPRTVCKLKKNKSRSWLFDYIHRVRLFPFNTSGHWSRPRTSQVYTGQRRLSKSPWTRPHRAVFIPTNRSHLTLGLPPVAVYRPQSKSLGKPITPQLRSDGYALMDRRFMPGAQRVPEYWRNCVIARDEHGKAAMQDYGRVYTRWQPAPKDLP